MSDFAYFVGADYKYIPELCALLNSLDYVGNLFDVYVIGMHLPTAFTEQFDKVKYRIIYLNISEDEIHSSRGISEVACRKRYWYAGYLGSTKGYKAICILDADLIFNRDPWQFFEIAEKTGFVLGVTKEQNKVYDDEHHKVYSECSPEGTFLYPPDFWNDMDICNCPIFIDPKIWGDAFVKSWLIFANQGFKAPDMDAMNLCLLKAGSHNQTIKLPGLQWLGTNEQHLKTYTKATIRRDGKLWTENGLEIFSFHGQFYHEKWRKTQLENRKGCIASRLNGSEKSYGDAVGALDVLTGVFNKMLDYKIQIEKRDYRHENH